jgi:hypothetical protein
MSTFTLAQTLILQKDSWNRAANIRMTCAVKPDVLELT